MGQDIHENFVRDESAKVGSDRAFGIVIAVAFAVIAAVNLWYAGRWWPWLFGIAAAFLGAALARPSALTPLNRLWFRFGLLLHRIVNPLVMGLIFYVTVWPTGVVMRALGRDLLRLERKPDSDSYWIVRRPPGPAPETMKDQF